MADPASILQFWFADAAATPAAAIERNQMWFGGGKELDEFIWETYSDSISDAANGRFDDWTDSVRERLALIILLDQLPRNIYRGTAEVFRSDAKALRCAQAGVAAMQLEELSVPEQAFFLMPYQHAENLSVQDEGVRLYGALADAAEDEWRPVAAGYRDFAIQHRDIIAEFGRFPHRNAVLGRQPTPAETLYLQEGGATFGQAEAK